jgi:hypothetical protein
MRVRISDSFPPIEVGTGLKSGLVAVSYYPFKVMSRGVTHAADPNDMEGFALWTVNPSDEPSQYTTYDSLVYEIANLPYNHSTYVSWRNDPRLRRDPDMKPSEGREIPFYLPALHMRWCHQNCIASLLLNMASKRPPMIAAQPLIWDDERAQETIDHLELAFSVDLPCPRSWRKPISFYTAQYELGNMLTDEEWQQLKGSKTITNHMLPKGIRVKNLSKYEWLAVLMVNPVKRLQGKTVIVVGQQGGSVPLDPTTVPDHIRKQHQNVIAELLAVKPWGKVFLNQREWQAVRYVTPDKQSINDPDVKIVLWTSTVDFLYRLYDRARDVYDVSKYSTAEAKEQAGESFVRMRKAFLRLLVQRYLFNRKIIDDQHQLNNIDRIDFQRMVCDVIDTTCVRRLREDQQIILDPTDWRIRDCRIDEYRQIEEQQDKRQVGYRPFYVAKDRKWHWDGLRWIEVTR